MGTNNLLSGYNHPLRSPPVLGRAHPMPGGEVSSQDAFYDFSIKVDKNLAWECRVLKLPLEINLLLI